jgi:biotin transport system substrate-specific component
MNPANPASAAPSLPLTQSVLIRRPLAIALGSLFVAVCAHISIPLWFTPVPVTLQPFAVLLLGLVFAPADAAAALVLYLVEGAAGLPVFSPHAPAGFVHLFGLTGGYLLSYPFVAWLTSWLRRRFTPSGFGPSLLAASAGSALILFCGALWLCLLTHQAPGRVLTLAVLPFLPGDILKVVVAAASAVGFDRFRRH